MGKTNPPALMNVREVARYLGINEKKIYFLAKTKKIPCTRVTGKWTFPKQLIDRWIDESASGSVAQSRGTADREVLLAAGSDDPALAILHDIYGARGATASLFIATVGSGAGLESMRRGVADFATAHLLDPRPPRETYCQAPPWWSSFFTASWAGSCRREIPKGSPQSAIWRERSCASSIVNPAP